MKFLVFNNTGGLGDTSKFILNWDSVKYVKPSSSSSFFIELNSGANIELTLSTGNASDVIDRINETITSAPSARILEVQSRNAFSFSSIAYNVAASGSIDGSGTANEIAVFTDPNTISSISNGTSGQVLTSNGSGSDPSFQTLNTGVSSSSFEIDTNAAGQLIDSIALDQNQWQAYYFGGLKNTLATELQGINKTLLTGLYWSGTDLLQPLVFALGADTTILYSESYSAFDTVLNPFQLGDQATGSGLPGWQMPTVSVGDPQYVWPNVMVPLGYSATNPWTSETRFIGQVICNNGVVTFDDARYITCDGTTLSGSLNQWVCYSKVTSFDFATNIAYREITIYFGGTTANVTIV